jgi:CRP/FNR family transcriptional regulator, cyclic AMP receptor protein
MQGYLLNFEKDRVICRAGDPSTDLYLLKKGRLLICLVNGTQVKALSRIEPGEFIGELSFFDARPRTANIITLEPSELIQIPRQEIAGFLPDWFLYVGKNLTKKIRKLDKVIQEKNLRKFGNEDHRPLTIEEQRHYYELLIKE